MRENLEMESWNGRQIMKKWKKALFIVDFVKTNIKIKIDIGNKCKINGIYKI